MIFKTDLPKDYIPYESLNFCSNLLQNCKFLISIGDRLPILISSGDSPSIWLSMIVDPKKKHYQDLVIASESKHPFIKVNSSKDNEITIYAKGQLILKVIAENRNSASIQQIDLRRVGFNIFGDENSLSVGGNTFSSNTFRNVETMIGLGEP